MEDPKAIEGNLEGNPLHEDQLEIVASESSNGLPQPSTPRGRLRQPLLQTVLHTEANPILGLNVVIDDERRLGFASFGHIATSHARAVDFVRAYAEVGVAGPRFDTVVTSSAGYPLDKTCECSNGRLGL